VRSQSTVQRLLRRQIKKKNTRYVHTLTWLITAVMTWYLSHSVDTVSLFKDIFFHISHQ
jgi:hypothetical protein